MNSCCLPFPLPLKYSDIEPDTPLRNVWPLVRYSAAAASLLSPYGTIDLGIEYTPAKNKLNVHGTWCRCL